MPFVEQSTAPAKAHPAYGWFTPVHGWGVQFDAGVFTAVHGTGVVTPTTGAMHMSFS